MLAGQFVVLVAAAWTISPLCTLALTLSLGNKMLC